MAVDGTLIKQALNFHNCLSNGIVHFLSVTEVGSYRCMCYSSIEETIDNGGFENTYTDKCNVL